MELLAEKQTLTTDQIDSLYYIVDIDNLPSILKHGILAHDTAKEMGLYKAQNDISNQDVQKIRRDKKFFSPRTKTKRGLHGYANAYLQPHNAMMVVIQKETSREQLCVVRVSAQILQDRKSEAVLTTKNAACHRARFFSPENWVPSPFSAKSLTSSFLSGLPSKKWAGRAAFQASKQSRQSEALFPGRIEPGYINTVYVHNVEVQTRVSAMLQSSMNGASSPAVMVHTSLFVSPKRGAFGKELISAEDLTNPCRLDLLNEVYAHEVDVEVEAKRIRLGVS